MINKYTNQEKNRFQKAIDILREEGLKSLVMSFLEFVKYKTQVAFSPLIIYLKPKRFFFFQNRKLPYFYHKYNITWTNERTIEVPFIWEIIKKNHGKRILEIGNVLSHYFPINHNILDKYEKAGGVINQDIIAFKPSNKYDLIVSISTLEHVGFDENVKDSTKIIKAIKNLKENCLKSKGKMIITLPIGYNLEMDMLLFTDKLEFDRKYFFGRINKKNEWKEISKKEAMNAKYGKPFNAANAIIVGLLKNTQSRPNKKNMLIYNINKNQLQK